MQSSVFRIHNFVATPNLNRFICITSVQCNQVRESRFLWKMLNSSKKKKLFCNSSGAPSRLPSLADEKFIPTHKTRRADVLNKLFMKHITDLMATGEVAPQLVGRGIDISQVSVTKDFKFLYVYWHSTLDTSINESTEQILRKCGGQLQHELSQLRIIGVVPPIIFIKDKRLSLLDEINKRISTIDSDEDCVSTNRIMTKNEPIVFTKLSPETKSEILNLSVNNQSEEEIDYDVDLPEMRHDVLGLNCSIIMRKIETSFKLAKTTALNQSKFTSDSKFPENVTVEKFLSNTERRELFNSFLKQQQIKNKSERKFRHENNEYSDESESDDDDDDYDNYDDVNDDLMEQDEDFIIEETNLENCK